MPELEAEKKKEKAEHQKTVAFFHPDLGIGGAERLVVDAAVGLQRERGWRVVIFTSHRDKSHCFEETKDGTLDVRVRGATLFPPTALGGRFKILLTILRHVHLVLSVAVLSDELPALRPDAFFVDQLSAGIPLLRFLFPRVPILFYCHFPDLLLASRGGGGVGGLVRRVWRAPFDWVEGWGMGGADGVVVNSEFTKGVVAQVWEGKKLGGERGVGVVYPCVDAEAEDDEDEVEEGGGVVVERHSDPWKGKKVILSINRFERKKDVALAIKAFAAMPDSVRERAKLIIAGGYDNRVLENSEYHKELEQLATKLGLENTTATNIATAVSPTIRDVPVLFLLSVPAQLKTLLLRSASLLVYTPANEHFGIVPLEAMRAGVPVLAADSGGPLETVVEGRTGWLRDPKKVYEWTDVMEKVVANLKDSERKNMGDLGRKRVREEFSSEKMAERFDDELDGVMSRKRVETLELQDLALRLGAVGAVAVAIVVAAFWQLR